jgi:Fe-S cluster biogenesis protein NfuA
MSAESSPSLVPLHPEACPGRPDRLRWVIPSGTLGFAGPVSSAPGRLGELLLEGVVASLEVEPVAVVVTLGAGRSWHAVGTTVRTALHGAVSNPDGWVPGAGALPIGDDALLRRVTGAVLAGPAGDYVRSHGGEVELVDACCGVVSIRFSGACRGCPALAFTLGGRIERALRASYPLLRELRAVG